MNQPPASSANFFCTVYDFHKNNVNICRATFLRPVAKRQQKIFKKESNCYAQISETKGTVTEIFFT